MGKRHNGGSAARTWLTISGFASRSAIGAVIRRHTILWPEHLAAMRTVRACPGRFACLRALLDARDGCVALVRYVFTSAIHLAWDSRFFADNAGFEAGIGGGDQFIRRAEAAVMWSTEREAALHQHAVHLFDIKRLFDVFDGQLVVEVLAREDVHREIVEFREGMDGDMAFGDHDDAGDARVRRIRSLILEHIGAADFGHADGGGVIIHHLLDEYAVGKFPGVTTRAVNNQVGSEHVTLLLMRGSPASCFRSGNRRCTN